MKSDSQINSNHKFESCCIYDVLCHIYLTLRNIAWHQAYMYHNQIIITFYMFNKICIIFSLSSISMAADMLFIYTSCIFSASIPALRMQKN